ncbi:MAG: septum site-determining protein MinD [Firmicutes bacterium]|nr:septum site-determining protein MinD [Bacillota bacterium]
MCEITAVVSGKGGSGKTMFASNLACVLAMAGKKVLLIDMNSGFRNLDICLGVENQVIFDLADVVNGVCSLNKALIPDRRFEALYLLSASQNYNKAKIKAPHMKKICDILAEKFEYIIIDTPAGIDESWQASIAAANRAVILLTQEFSAVRCSDTIDSKLRENGITKRYAVVNKVRSEYSVSGFFPGLAEISESLRIPLAGIIQEDINIHIATNNGVPVVCKADSYICKNFEKMCSRIFE